MKYQIVAQGEALDFLLNASLSERRAVAAALAQLCLQPFQEGRCPERDATGRRLEAVRVGRFLVTFWGDHSVQELRAVKIERIR